MALEVFTGWIKDLVSSNPTGTDPKSQGDDHLRGIKQTLGHQFSGFTTATPVTVTADKINHAATQADGKTLGTASVVDVTTSPTDTTSGRVWRTNDMVKTTGPADTTAGSVTRVGDGGLLSSGVATTNLNTVSTTGFYKVGGSDTGVPASNTLGYSVIHQGDGTSATQVAKSLDDGRTFTRVITAGVPGSWVEVSTSANENALGVGQTWQNMTGSRSLGTPYTNGTGRPISVSVYSTFDNDSDPLELLVDGVSVAKSRVGSGTTTQLWVGGVVPSGSTYTVPSGRVLSSWAELR